MSQETAIEWTHRPGTIGTTWNPVRGCSMAKGSEAGGCLNCYAARMSARNLPGHRSPTTGKPFAVMRGAGPRWTGDVELIPDKLAEPLRWRKPRTVFVNSMSDLFHERLSDEAIAAVFGVMAIAKDHTFLILTKRPERAAEDFARGRHELMQAWAFMACNAVTSITGQPEAAALAVERAAPPFPLPNVWLGTSVEDQATADQRIPHLLRCPAAVRFVSYEPALGPVRFEDGPLDPESTMGPWSWLGEGIDWIIAGGESGPGARPPHPDWFRSARDQCAAAKVPFFFKQWGEWMPALLSSDPWCYVAMDGRQAATESEALSHPETAWTRVHRVGKKRAGAMLDGREHRQWPGTPCSPAGGATA